MRYTYEYDLTYHPSMPVAEIEIVRTLRDNALKLVAIIDSGADATIIPLHYLKEIRARKVQTGWLRGTALNRVKIDLYAVSLRLSTFHLGLMRVVGSDHYEEAILGRDVLNQLIVTMNGLASTVEISD
jgi:predicted aspartyl protease